MPGLGMRYLTIAPSWLRYPTTATFPIYVLHLPLLIITAYYLQTLPVPWYVQLALVIIVTVVTAFALYEYVIRRMRVTRFLFGLESPRASP
jgi:glucans biosynthesis protein C